jgi:hypothetical protein
MSTGNNPGKILRESNRLLDGDVVKNPTQLQRWLVVQVKKLARQSQVQIHQIERLNLKIKHLEKRNRERWND